MNWKQFSVYFIIVFSTNYVYAQNPLILNSVDNGTGVIDNKDYNSVILLPGYSCESEENRKMNAFIDLTIFGQPNYTQIPPYSLNFPEISSDLSVGQTPYSVNVNMSGGLTYDIPVYIPTGTRGMQPQITLSYNSQNPLNGIAGSGWGISGTSSITRGNRTIYFDHKTESIKWSAQDALYLDGSRLVKSGTSQTWEQDGVYHLEIGQDQQAISHGVSGNGSEWFEIKSKDGMTREYGRTENSRISHSNGSVLSWNLNKVIDQYGNYVEYIYRHESNQLFLEEILYTGTINTEPYNRILFLYDERNDATIKFVNGVEVNTNLILREIRSYSEGLLARKLTMTYLYDQIGAHPCKPYSFLKEVTEYGSSQDQLNSLLFEYGHNSLYVPGCPNGEYCFPIVSSINPFSIPGNNLAHYRTGDFNGDGLTDVIAFGYFLDDNDLPEYELAYLFVNTGNNNYSLLPSATFSLPQGFALDDQAVDYGSHWPGFYPLFITHSPNYPMGTQLLDLNGDGLQDLVLQHPGPPGTTYYTPWLSTGTSFIEMTDNRIQLINQHQWSLQMTDVNGDGSMEMVLVRHSFPDFQTIQVHFFDTGNGNSETKEFSNNVSGNRLSSRMIPFRMDADGKSEVLAWKHNSNEILLVDFTFNNQYINSSDEIVLPGSSTLNVYNTGIQIPYDYAVYPGDINGDGRDDLLVANPFSGEWYVYINEHNGDINSLGPMFKLSPTSGLDPFTNSTSNSWSIADFDGDGNVDVANLSPNEITIYYLVGDIWSKRKFLSSVPFLPNSQNDSYYYNFGDTKGNGALDLYVQRNDNGELHVLEFSNSPQQNLIKRTRDSFGRKTHVIYSPLSPGESYSQSTTLLSNKFLKINNALQVVTSIEADMNNGAQSQTNYFYEDAIFHKLGRGYLGFLKQRSESIHDISEYISDYVIESETSTLLPSTTLVKKNNIEVSFSEKSFDIEVLQSRTNPYYGNQDLRFRVDLSFNNSENYITGQTSSQILLYDNDGNISEITESLNGNSEVTETTFSNYTSFDNWWIPSLPERKTISSQRLSEQPIETIEDYTYSPELVSTTLNPGTEAWSKTETTLNTHGNISATIISGAEIDPIETDSYLYSSNGRFVEQHINAFDQSISYTYNTRWGTVKKAIDHLDRYIIYKYNNFGTLTKQLDHKENITSYSLDWADSPPTNGNCESLSDVLFHSSVAYSNNRFRKTHFNRFGLARLKEWSGQFDDLQEVMCYDDFGRIISQTSPHYLSDTDIQSRSYQYDELNRIWSETFGLTENWHSYELTTNGYKSSLSSNALGQRSSLNDLTGRQTQSTDVGGTLDYEYFSGGLLKTVKLNDIELTSNEYDDYGRQTALIDKNAGTTNYVYDSFNRLIDQTDARGNNAQITYDNLGRMSTKDIHHGPVSIGTYSYDYYQTGHQKHKLEKVTAPSANSTGYTYDEDENLTSIMESIDGEDYTSAFEYDPKGRPIRKIYPSGFAVRYEYDNDKEYLYRIVSDDGQLVIWEIQNSNSQGQILQYTLGNGSTINMTYDGHYSLQSVIANVQNEPVFSFEYEFNPINGNLNKRNLGIVDEEFKYDEDGFVGLNRLTSSEISDFEPEIVDTYTYTANGNLESKTGVGEYVYNTNKINAVDHIDWQGGVDEENATQIMLMQTVSYNHFNSVSELINVDNNLKVEFTYGPDDQRRKASYYTAGTEEEWELQKTRFYIGDYEKQIDATNNEIEVHYISAGGMIVAMFVIENGIGQYYYPHQDHLGSIIHVTDENAEIIYTQNFDAWGRTRNADDFTYEDITERPNWLWRGYTGHEHLDEFGLINMNGRLYDPVIGRMLSPDNYVQSPDYSQSFNRYSYVWNNPLKYTDPTGEIVDLINAIVTAVTIPARVMDEATSYTNDQINGTPRSTPYFDPHYIVGNGDPLPYPVYVGGQIPSQTVAIDGSRIMGGQVGSAGFTDAAGNQYQLAEKTYLWGHWYSEARMGNLSMGPVKGDPIYKTQTGYVTVVGGGQNPDIDRMEADGEVVRIPPSEMKNFYYGGAPDLIGWFSIAAPAKIINAAQNSRAFFSGVGAEARAISEGYTTLSQTRAGKNLLKMTEGMPWFQGSQAYNWWARLSSTYAKGVPKGSTVNVYLNNPSSTGIWNAVEKPILQQRGVHIIYR